jgi:hypothetical protein
MSQVEQAAGRSRRNRNWLYVFAAFAVLGLLAMGINWAYNVGQLLKPEDLTAARDRWRQNRPAAYSLRVQKQTGVGTLDEIRLKVRDGQIVEFLLNGREPEPLMTPDGKRLVDEERRQREYYDVDGLFDSIDAFIEQDREKGQQAMMRAKFDTTDGHVIMFMRQAAGKLVVRIVVELKRDT